MHQADQNVPKEGSSDYPVGGWTTGMLPALRCYEFPTLFSLDMIAQSSSLNHFSLRLQDALERAATSEDHAASAAASRMSLTVADSIDVATEVATRASGDGASASTRERLPAVVYLDPMFPRRKKTALVKKDMRMLQALVEEEMESNSGAPGNGRRNSTKEEEERKLFDVAMRLATRKVVVKRPLHGPEIVDHVAPSHCVVSKNGRFDVYAVTEGS